jgi:hypothetical protein
MTVMIKFREYGFRPDFCEANDPESKGIVENLVGHAKRDLIVPQAPFIDLAAANAAAAAWCVEVNSATHTEVCAVPAERLVTERELLTPLPSLRVSIGRLVTGKVDRLSNPGRNNPTRRRGSTRTNRDAIRSVMRPAFSGQLFDG